MPQGRTMRSFPPEEEEGVAETTWNGLGLTASLILCPRVEGKEVAKRAQEEEKMGEGMFI